MPRPKRRSPATAPTALLLGAVALAGGCYPAPRHAADLHLADPNAIARSAPRYWDPRGLPAAGEVPGDPRVATPADGADAAEGTLTARDLAAPRVAVLEFSVEFVTAKKLGLFGSRPIADIQEFSITGGAAHLAGLGREKLELDPATMAELPGALSAQFERTLESAGFEVVPAGQVAAAPEFAALEGEPAGVSIVGQFLSPVGSDTGRPKEILVYPAPGLKVLPRDHEGCLPALRGALARAGADLGLIVRVRVGADGGFATIERDSTIRVVSAEGVARLTARHSILSDGRIASGESFRLFSGSVTTADPALYRGEVERIADPFLAMAVATLRPGSAVSAAGAVSGLTPAQLARLLFDAGARTAEAN